MSLEVPPVPEDARAAAVLEPLASLLASGEALARIGAFVWRVSDGQHHWSLGLRRILGVPPDGEVDLGWVQDRVHPDDRKRVARLAKVLLAGHDVEPTEIRLRLPDGRTVQLYGQARAEFDPGGRVRSVHGAVMDVTERRQLEGQLLQAQKLEAVGTLAGGMAHDFNNILQVIGGHAALIKLDPDLRDRSRQSLDEIEAALTRCRELIQRLLAFGRRHTSSPTLNEARTLLGGTTRMLERLLGDDVVLEARLGSEPCPVRIDPVEFEQVVVNLAINARAAMPSGGTISIDLRRRSLWPEHALALAIPSGEYCCLEVRDTGTGIPEHVRERIFEPFFTTKPVGEGTGLGLSTVHGIVHRARGAIQVESELGRGAVFRVFLPLSSSEPTLLAAATPEPSFVGGSETILLVEDSEQVREVTRSQLETAGYRVLPAPDGESALTAAKEYSGPIHLLLSDMMLPGISGAEIELELRAARPDLRALLMSGYTERLVIGRTALAGQRITLHKPFSMKELLQAVREELERS